MTDDQIRELVGGRQTLHGEMVGFESPQVKVETGDGATREQLKLAQEMRKRQAEVERESRQAATEAGTKGQLGFAREMAEMNAQIAKWTTFSDDQGIAHQIALTRDAWVNVIDQLERRWRAFRRNCGFRRRRTLIPKGTRTAFRAEGEQSSEQTDAAIAAARENAALRQTQLVRDQNRQIFDSLKRQAEGVFDALLTKSQSIWSAIGNSLKTALLTAIKDVVTSRVATMLMQLFTGARASFAAGTGGGMLGRLGGVLGAGAVPVFGSGAPLAPQAA